MAGDYTRLSFDPMRHHSGVRMQQGRVQLDADWNELVAIFDRRFRAETYDLIGPSGVADRDGATGFRIAWSGSTLSIGRGRMYVNGLVAENHGAGTLEYEPRWGERRFNGDTPLDSQPYMLPPYPAVNPTGAGPHMVYVDVWERELTAVDDPRLLERALGVDTAARVQVVWQVRVFTPTGGGAVSCANFLTNAEWLDETRPSGARMSNGTIVPTEPADPCAVSPVGGYHGRENRLYRIEVHDDGSAGTPATFKWSKDNGSVQARILGIDAAATQPRLTVDRVGRDPVLRFRRDDWVELIDDPRELAGRPGVMAKVAEADPATNTIVLTAPTSGAIDTARNARVRRWEPNPNADSGLIPVSGGFVYLGDGIQVQVTIPTGERARVGDYWTFAARVADPQIETVDNALPQGIRHHYAPLAVVGSAGAAIEDCRPRFPLQPPAPVAGTSCDCTECVDPVSHRTGRLTIQEAIDRVRRSGGKVCLAPGTYVLQRPLRIQGARSVQLAGKGHRSAVVYNGRGPAIQIDRCHEVTIERLSVASAASGLGRYLGSLGTRRGSSARRPEIGIAVRNSAGVTIERCLIAQSAPFWTRRAARRSGRARGAARDRVGIGIALAGTLVRTLVRDCVVFADAGVATLAFGRATVGGDAPAEEPGGGVPLSPLREDDDSDEAKAAIEGAEALRDESPESVRRYLATFDLRIVDNVLACTRAGIDLARFGGLRRTSALVVHDGDTRIAGNSIYGCDRGGIALAGHVEGARYGDTAVRGRGDGEGDGPGDGDGGRPGDGDGGREPTVDPEDVARVDVVRNVLAVEGPGVVVACDNARVAENDIAIPPSRRRVDGIVAGAGSLTPLRGLVVARNRVVGTSGSGVRLRTEIVHAAVRGNSLEGTLSAGIEAGVRQPSGVLSITDNAVRDVGRGRQDAALQGIAATGFERVDVVGNRVEGVGADAVASESVAGIRVVQTEAVRVAGNHVNHIGPQAKMAGEVRGIDVVGPFVDVDASDNTVRVGFVGDGTRPGAEDVLDTGGVAFGESERRHALVIADGKVDVTMPPKSGEEPSDRDPSEDPLGKEAIERLTRPILHEVGVGPVDVAIHGNSLEGNAARGALRVEAGAALVVTGNRCRTIEGGVSPGVTTLLVTDRPAVVGNNLVSGSAQAGLVIFCPGVDGRAVATVTGNVVEPGILVNGGMLPLPWSIMNVT